MRLVPGQAIDIVFTDGRLEIEVPATPVDLTDDGLPSAVPTASLPQLTADTVREVLEATRR